LNEPPSDYSRFLTDPTPDLRTFLGDESKKTKIEQGRDTLARRRIPNIVGLVPSFIFFALPPGTQWIVERLIVYCMIIDILPEILLIDIYKLYRYRWT